LLSAPPGRRTRFFDLGNVGAEVAKNHRTKGARRKLGQIEHFDSGKRRLWHRDVSCAKAWANPAAAAGH
jgi:hypothetical protein